ncbi:MAG: SPOR domain-containing protein [Proteobacteria bacterium]|nr:SPOR domain-containing protein [Pseudomonadota bacterium]MBU1708439.1 SPOR domain-containing protein [Pseudomonadota bacterium]
MKSSRIRKINLLSKFRKNGNSPLQMIPPKLRLPLVILLIALPVGAFFLLRGSDENNISSPPMVAAPQQAMENNSLEQLPQETVASAEPVAASPAEEIAIEIPKVTPVQRTEPADNQSRTSFALHAGTGVARNHFQKLQKIAERLGLPLELHADEQKVNMTRLYLGSYQAPAAEELLKKLQKDTFSSFAIHQDGKIAIYGGSYYYSVNARIHKAKLEGKGYTVEEITTKQTMPVYTAYLGNFASKDEAARFKGSSKEPTIKEMEITEIPDTTAE